MEIIQIYKCLGDESRLRILNLLREGPLCGCHFREALGMDQVKISKQLIYMKRLGVLAAEREANWMIYRLAEPVHPLLTENLENLRRCAGESLPFPEDDARLASIMQRIVEGQDPCPQLIVASAKNSACCTAGA